MRRIASRLEASLLTALTPGSLFKALGFKYYGPVDGHDVKSLVKLMRDIQRIPGPKLLHVVTVKGKGFAPAEKDQVKWHASGSPFDKITGASLAVKPARPAPPKYQDVFADTLIEIAKRDPRVYGITAAMPSGTGLLKMMNEMPDRCFDVGIAEQHAVTFAAGMATQGLKPFVAIYSSFLQRGYDQVVHDVLIQDLPVVFCMDRAGLVGADGPTHHGLYDIPYLRAVPSIVLASPLNEVDLRDMMHTAAAYDGSFAIRYPRGEGEGLELPAEPTMMPVGKGVMLRDGQEVAVLSYGPIGNTVLKAAAELDAQGMGPAVVDMRFAKPLDTDLIDTLVSRFHRLVTVEDGTRLGGFGSAVAEYVADKHPGVQVVILGVPDRIIDHGSPAELYAEVGLDASGIAAQVSALWPVRSAAARW
jgi:1-deoxy-D-xylulose-5-phosphate synthase